MDQQLMSEWQPIDTAPHRGDYVLAWAKGWDCPQFLSWYEMHPRAKQPGWERIGEADGWWDLNKDNPPTHWLPLPATPDSAGVTADTRHEEGCLARYGVQACTCRADSVCRCVREDGTTRFNINCHIHGKAP